MNDQFQKLKAATEMTTSGDIAYARGELQPADPASKELLKDRSDKLNKETARQLLQKEVKEQHEAKLPKLKIQIMKQVDGIIGTSKLRMEQFHIAFVGSGLQDAGSKVKAAVHYQSIPEDLEKLEKSLPDSVGELELILAALKNKKSVKNYEPFENFDELFVARMQATVNGIRLIYEGSISLGYVATENLYVGDVDKAEEISEENPNVKRVNQLIFPIGGTFDQSFFGEVKDIILTDKETKQKKEKE